MNATVFETHDAETAHQVLADLYRIRRFSSGGERVHLRVRQDRAGPVGLHQLDFSMTCDMRGDPLHTLYIGHVIDGAIGLDDGSGGGEEERIHGKGDVFLVAQPDRPFEADIAHGLLEYADFTEDLLAKVADPAPGRSAQPIRFTGYEPATTEDAELWLRTYRYVGDVFDTSAVDQPMLVNAAALMLAATALTVFPNTAVLEPDSTDRNDAHPAALRRAVKFIEEHASDDITPADIAEAARVTIRAVQLAFRRHLNTTPSAYLRRVRLERAHQDLLAADPAGTTVTEVAATWGFWHPGRFAAHHQAAYGEAPAATLHSR